MDLKSTKIEPKRAIYFVDSGYYRSLRPVILTLL